jgi:Predicted transcriptional regulators
MILQAREKLGLTQEQLAKRVGVTKNAISNYENGVRVPKWAIALRLSKELKIPLEKIFPIEK